MLQGDSMSDKQVCKFYKILATHWVDHLLGMAIASFEQRYGLRWTAGKNSINCSAYFYKCGFYFELEAKSCLLFLKAETISHVSL